VSNQPSPDRLLPQRRVAVVFGTRPEAIKLVPIILKLRRCADLGVITCATGQHKEMADQVLVEFGIEADENLRVMAPDQTLSGLTAALVERLDQFFDRARPDLVLVQGDTTTTLCATLTAFYRKIPVAHVEAGLRTGDLKAPWPEEGNRVLVSRLASIHFAPTVSARENLLAEGILSGSIHVTGNTVVDSLLIASQRVEANWPHIHGLPENWRERWGDKKIVLVTGHRRESFGAPFSEICWALADLVEDHPEAIFVYPVHLNPNVRGPVTEILGRNNNINRNLWLIDPVSYFGLIALLKKAFIVLTDSGGIQEEAPTFGKPVLIMREKTERTEAVLAGMARLVGPSRDAIVRNVTELLRSTDAYRRMTTSTNPFGNGHASELIIERCRMFLNLHAPSSCESVPSS
jgi:UDP-N-acetylglucosamine 2-epimerase (non-hydrolysing)